MLLILVLDSATDASVGRIEPVSVVVVVVDGLCAPLSARVSLAFCPTQCIAAAASVIPALSSRQRPRVDTA